MKLDQLAYFLEAAKHEHLGRAARALSISAGAVSQSISALEREFGREFFERRGKRIHLTDHGKLLIEKARKLLLDAESIREEISSDRLELRGHYRLAGAHVLSVKFLLPAWVSLQNSNPYLTAEVFTLRSSQVVNGIIEGGLDFGVCFSPQTHIDLSSETLRSGQLLVALRKGHPLFKMQPKARLQALSKYPATLPKSFQGIEVCEKHPVFEKFGIQVRTDCLFDSYHLAVEKVASSDSWAFLPDWLIQGDGRLCVIPPPKSWDAPYFVSAIWSKNRARPKAMSDLLALIRGFALQKS